MVIFLCELVLFFLLAPFEVPSSSISMLAGGPVAFSLPQAFLAAILLTGMIFGSATFSFPLLFSWITLTALSSASSGKGGIFATGWGGHLSTWGCTSGGGGGAGACGLSQGRVTCLASPLPWLFPAYLLGWGAEVHAMPVFAAIPAV